MSISHALYTSVVISPMSRSRCHNHELGCATAVGLLFFFRENASILAAQEIFLFGCVDRIEDNYRFRVSPLSC